MPQPIEMSYKTQERETFAFELAKRTRFLREVVAQQLERERSAPDVLSGFFEAFQTYLIGTLTAEQLDTLYPKVEQELLYTQN